MGMSFLSFLVCALLSVDRTDAWGPLGHYATAAVAESMLDSTTLATTKTILKGQSMTDVASWPDQVKHEPQWRWSSPLHFCDSNNAACTISYRGDCHDRYGNPGRCVIGAVHNYTIALKADRADGDGAQGDGSSPLPGSGSSGDGDDQGSWGGDDQGSWGGDDQGSWGRNSWRSDNQFIVRGVDAQRFAALAPTVDYNPHDLNQWELLTFIVHYVGDMHQPLHEGRAKDLGGNRIRVHFEGRRTELHAIWDSLIIEKRINDDFNGDKVQYCQYLSQQAKNFNFADNDVSTCSNASINCLVSWANESSQDACKYAYAGVTRGEDLG
eukprot:Ihof_evm4s314 gene=Ihof_evmTU4s314